MKFLFREKKLPLEIFPPNRFGAQLMFDVMAGVTSIRPGAQ
jgi:hypothetical protein